MAVPFGARQLVQPNEILRTSLPQPAAKPRKYTGAIVVRGWRECGSCDQIDDALLSSANFHPATLLNANDLAIYADPTPTSIAF